MKFLLCGLLIASFHSTALSAELTQEEYDRRYAQAVESVERKYPQAKDDTSYLSVLLTYKVLKAHAANDPILEDPYFIMRLADDLAKEMKEIGMEDSTPPPQKEVPPRPPEVQAPLKPSGPTAAQLAEREEQEAAKSGDVQAYLRQSQKGHMGADPKLQTQARSGDLLARAELGYDAKLRAIKGKVAAGYLTEAEAIVERGSAQAAYTTELQQIQSAAQHQELMDEVQKRRR